MSSEGKYDSKTDSKTSDCDEGEGWLHLEFADIEIGDKIGGGGVGIIYNGWFREEPVAVKTLMDTRLDDALKQEYLDELLIMSRLRHSNIVSFIGACMTPPNLCFVMELCETSLFSLLHKDRVDFTPYEACQIGLDVASAMEYLHAQRPPICHRDLKSHNVLRAYNGAYKICDFGLVKNKNATAGTPCYMAPELLSNKFFNKSVDVYSFGILFCEIFDRKVPFHMLTVAEIVSRVLDGDRPPVPGVGAGCPESCAVLINRCWATAAEDRPDFSVIVDDLLEISKSVPDTKYSEDLKSSVGDSLDELFRK